MLGVVQRIVFAFIMGCQGELVAPAQSDASVADTGAPSDNLLENGNFELGCADWFGFESRTEDSSDGRNGGKACMVCGDPTVDGFGILQKIPIEKLTVGKTYFAEVWVRAAPSDASVAPDPSAVFYLNGTDPTTYIERKASAPVSADATWKRLTVVITVKAGTVNLEFNVLLHGRATCILVDDAVVGPM